MNDNMMLKTELKTFIQKHWDGHRPLLLALSGGPDSLMLLQLLLKLKIDLHFEFAIAHVDHRWRPSSEEEAKSLEQSAQQRGIPFHLKILSPNTLKGNLESACREERFLFFRQLCLEHGYQAVLLGHHADDQAETVLKRIFEGTSLPYLTALRPVTCLSQLTLWRPLLNCRKNDLIEELKSCGIKAFEDETNKDPRFLRARFRTKLLPLLANEFGKEINTHLKNLGSEAQELNAYLDEQTQFSYSKLLIGPFGSMLDLTKTLPMPPLEQKHLIRRFCKNCGLSISKEALATAVHLLTHGIANKSISCGKQKLYIDRYRLFALKTLEEKSTRQKPLELIPGDHSFYNWSATVETTENIHSKPQDWRDVWKGEVTIFLPKSEMETSRYTLDFPKPGDCYPNSSPLAQWWNKAKVPGIVRLLVPVVFYNGKVIHEFLSGRTSLQNLNTSETLKLLLKVNEFYDKIR